jgi:hypothetical protein
LTKLPHQLKRIRLNLARSREFPTGSALHGYEFVAPLDTQGYIEPKLWKEQREHCRVRRFWNGDAEQIGWLVHKPGGPEHARWVFDYDATMMSPDIGSVAMPSAQANTCRSHMTTICIPSR